jgi:PKD repeat protein
VIRFSLSTALVLIAIAFVGAAPAGAATADFTVAPGTTVDTGTPVNFTSTSQEDPLGGPILTYQWELDGVAFDSDSDATRTFDAPGTFTVTLTVTDLLGSDTSDPVTITVIEPPPPPTVSFTAAPTVALIGQSVTFTPQSSSGITAASWDFGNGTVLVSGAPQPITRLYSARGTYTVVLTVRDSRGRTAEASQNVRIHAPPIAQFDVFPSDPRVGQEIILFSDSSDADGPLAAQAWDLDGDGAYAPPSGTRIRGMFTSPGPHVVGLKVTDSDGEIATLRKTINVKDSNWLAPITPSGQVNTNAPPPPSITNQPFLRLLSPFPIVRLAGWPMELGARIEVLGVRAPAGARVLVRCRGEKCPVKRVTGSVAKKKPKPVRFRRFRRFFPAGSVIEIFVRRTDRLGKYTRFKIRSHRKRWKRMDGCVAPNSTRPVTCPAD